MNFTQLIGKPEEFYYQLGIKNRHLSQNSTGKNLLTKFSDQVIHSTLKLYLGHLQKNLKPVQEAMTKFNSYAQGLDINEELLQTADKANFVFNRYR